MSSRALFCAAVLAFGVPATGRAQDVAQLQAIRIRLQHEADSLQAARRAGPPLDTVRLADGWTLLVNAAARPYAEREVPAALAAAMREFGTVISPSAGPVRVRFDSLTLPALEVSFVGAGQGAFAGARRLEAGAIGKLVRAAARNAAWAEADPALRSWSGGQALETSYAEIAPAARIRLGRDTGTAVIGCRSGTLSACERALATPGGLSEVVRTSLFRYALERAGGVRRLGDLYADPSRPVLDRLAAIAGEPRDQLVAEWRAQVVGLGALTGRAAIVAALGAFVLAGLGFWGVRWRHV
jgi:hypothetical protein